MGQKRSCLLFSSLQCGAHSAGGVTGLPDASERQKWAVSQFPSRPLSTPLPVPGRGFLLLFPRFSPQLHRSWSLMGPPNLCPVCFHPTPDNPPWPSPFLWALVAPPPPSFPRLLPQSLQRSECRDLFLRPVCVARGGRETGILLQVEAGRPLLSSPLSLDKSLSYTTVTELTWNLVR